MKRNRQWDQMEEKRNERGKYIELPSVFQSAREHSKTTPTKMTIIINDNEIEVSVMMSRTPLSFICFLDSAQHQLIVNNNNHHYYCISGE